MALMESLPKSIGVWMGSNFLTKNDNVRVAKCPDKHLQWSDVKHIWFASTTSTVIGKILCVKVNVLLHGQKQTGWNLNSWSVETC
jgi:hypothetical protein